MKERIVFVDDDALVLKGLRRALQDYNDLWDTNYFSNVSEAERLIYNEPCDVAVVDVFMPLKSGLDLLRQVKSDARTCDMEVIVLTGMQEGDLKRQALELGAVDLLNKPVEAEDLVARIKSALKIKSYRAELMKKNNALQHQLIQSHRMEVVGLLASGVAHDLNNILAAITGYSELVTRRLSSASSETGVEELAEKIVAASGRAGKITGQILKFARQTTTVKEHCRVSDIIRQCVDTAAILIPEDIQIVVKDQCLDGAVDADSGQLYQVFMNLIINGAHAMGEQGRLEICVCEEMLSPCDLPVTVTREREEFVKVTVSDTGQGMDEETLKHIFDPLYTTKGGKGTGLGLSIARLIVGNHRGHIAVESSPGWGSIFTVLLPAANFVIASPVHFEG